MAQLISVKLSRFDGSPWGFRLQGGKDFGTPLIVQKVRASYFSPPLFSSSFTYACIGAIDEFARYPFYILC